MGYETSFTGSFKIEPPLTPHHKAYLDEFAGTRRMKRDGAQLVGRPDPLREAVGLPLGEWGEYFVGANIPKEHWTETGIQFDKPDSFGQTKTPDVLDYNRPPGSQPSLWCMWGTDEAGEELTAESGKSYEYRDWLEYLIERFFVPWGYALNGTVEWRGEDDDDRGRMILEDSVLRTQHAVTTWEDD
jgi:hypothetical protein